MNALVTGGAGFIGSHLVEALLARDDKVWMIDDLSTGRFENIAHLEEHPGFQYVIDTILDERVVSELTAKVDVVFHLAAAVGVQYIIDNPLKALETNIRGTEIVLQQANEYKKKVMIFSTSEIYGKANHQPCAEDDDRVLGSTTISRWGYSSSKAIDEFLALAYHREKQLPVVIVRLFNTCGPRQTGQYGMVIPRFVKQALLDHPLTVYGDGQQTRCFCDVSDVVSGVLALIEEPAANGEVLNLGSDEETTIEELARRVLELTGSDSEIEFIPYEKAYEEGFEDMRRRIPDLSKIRSLVGYEPRISLAELLERVVADFKR
ncbi:MAG: NAD-dependent epimerase/dehydratase family protein [Candidatus Eisenbacteria bacterium]|nr:NAD-dependent epimerase/dehydratase family protein [Candidatus Eisenbacteria bacterium]